MPKAQRQKERGMALLLALFALLLLSAIGLCMVLASDTETRIDANYSSSLRSYYAARSGLEEVRDRIKYPSSSAGGLADLLPQDVAGNAGGVLYVLNPAGGETVDPTDPSSPYFDDQLCHDYNSGVAAKDSKCTVLPGTSDWQLHPQYSPVASASLGYKWIRINFKTNRIAAPYCVDQVCDPALMDARVCWDGQTEQLSPGGTNPSCDANGMLPVYMLTSLAATAQAGGPAGSRKLLRLEVVAPSIRPPGALTMGASSTLPVLGGGIPAIALDGHPHTLDGAPATSASCSAIAPLATDSPTGSAQLEQALDVVRKNIVEKANASCNADGSGLSGNSCPAALWWVRGTNTTFRFVTTGSNSGTSTSGTTATSTTSSGFSGSNSGDGGSSGSDGGHDGDGGHHHHDPTGVADNTGACNPSDPTCYTNLDLAAPELFATSAVTGTDVPTVTLPSDSVAPFTGGLGNQADASIYQPGTSDIINNGIKAIDKLVSASVDQPNYYAVSSASLAPSYGTRSNPAIVVITDSALSLQNSAVGLSGYGVLVIPSALEISNAPLRWTGIVVIKSSSGHVTIGSGASGFINGALLIQPGAALNLLNTTTTQPSFRLMYSCEAIDLPFASKPFRIISPAETSF
jgi:hypothetical protein